MAQTYATEVAGVDQVPAVKASAMAGQGPHLTRYRATVALAAQASGDTIVLADVPAGMIFAYGVLTSSVSLGSSTVAVGNASAAGKYRTAAAFTATDTPTLFGNTTAVSGASSTATERVLATIGAASLPGAGTVVVDLYFSKP